MKVVLIDDEQAARKILRHYCLEWDPDLNMVGEAGRISEAISLIQKTEPDLVLLDIEFPEGTGFEVLEALPDFDFQVIFITAHDDYALQAFKHHALNYILKPINYRELVNSLDKAKKQIEIKSDSQWKSALDQLLNNNNRKIQLPIKDGYRYIDLNKLVYLKADGSYTHLVLEDNETLMISKNLKWLEKQLATSNFIRVHRGYLINKDHIYEVHRNNGGYIIMHNKERVPVSRSFQIDRIVT
ncbi:MAG: LytTR family DNA-binding domain-containing protein [Vicingaceae bacterium]